MVLWSLVLASAAAPAVAATPATQKEAADLSGDLDLDTLIAAVLASNPEAAMAQATLARSQALAQAAGPWPDPMVDLGVAPMSLGGMPGWQLSARQDLPLWGSQRTARLMALADADAAAARRAMMHLELADMAAMAWSDWYAQHRELELVAWSLRMLQADREAGLSRFAAGRASQQEVLQVEAEIASLVVTQRSLETERDLTAVRLNTLLNRDPAGALPAPPASLARPEALAPEQARPERAEALAMTQAAEAGVRMARIDRLPMLGLMVGWDSMATMPDARLMTGLSVSVPLAMRRRAAAVDAAQAELSWSHAELDRVTAAVGQDVAEAERRYTGQLAVLDVLQTQLLPVTRARVEADRAAYASGTGDVRLLLESERAFLDAQIRQQRALASLQLRAAQLCLARGQLPTGDRL